MYIFIYTRLYIHLDVYLPNLEYKTILANEFVGVLAQLAGTTFSRFSAHSSGTLRQRSGSWGFGPGSEATGSRLDPQEKPNSDPYPDSTIKKYPGSDLKKFHH